MTRRRHTGEAQKGRKGPAFEDKQIRCGAARIAGAHNDFAPQTGKNISPGQNRAEF